MLTAKLVFRRLWMRRTPNFTRRGAYWTKDIVKPAGARDGREKTFATIGADVCSGIFRHARGGIIVPAYIED